MLNTFTAGQIVRNLGTLAKVSMWNPETNYLLLRPMYADGSYWVADPDKCEPVEDSHYQQHKLGLVTF